MLWDQSLPHIGGTKYTLVECCVNASSVTRPPKQEVSSARFRDELYASLGGVAVLRPLRNHPEDVVPLGIRFIRKYKVKFGEEAEVLDPTVIIFPKPYCAAGVGRFRIETDQRDV